MKLIVKQMPIARLMQSFHELNPKKHQERSIEKTAASLLAANWCVYGVVYNTKNKKLVGGHRRVLAAQYLTTQTKDWFAEKYSEAQAEQPEIDISDSKNRYAIGFWIKVPTVQVYLDEISHQSMMIYLNNTESEGIDNPDKLRALVAKWQESIAASGVMRRLSSIDDRILAEATNFRIMMGNRLPEKMDEIIASTSIEFPAWEPSKSEDPTEEMSIEEDEEDENAEPDITEGGANFNADPKESTRRETLYPLAIVITQKQKDRFDRWKESEKVNGDQQAFERGFDCFADSD